MASHIERRKFLATLGGAAAAWPLGAHAQQPGKLPTIGFLGANTASTQRRSTDAFVQRLRELGWIENRTVAIEYRWGEGRDERFAEIAAEFVRLKVCHSHFRNPVILCSEEGDRGYSNRVCRRWRPGRYGPRHFTSATGRQHHRLVDPANRCCQQAPRTVARDSPRSPRGGDFGQYQQPKLRARNGRGSGGGSHGRPHRGHIRGSRSRGYRAGVRRAKGPRRCTLCLWFPPSDDQIGFESTP
jgi:hypothetical protein